jgi:hypothetical protein
MAYKYNDPEDKLPDILDSLIKIPRKNLEAKICQIEQDINQRKNLNSMIISRLLTLQSRFKDHVRRLRYNHTISSAFKANKDAAFQLLQFQEAIDQELLSCFKDLSYLSDKLLKLREELEINKQKQFLME